MIWNSISGLRKRRRFWLRAIPFVALFFLVISPAESVLSYPMDERSRSALNGLKPRNACSSHI